MVQGSVEARREPGSNSPVFLSSHLQSFVGLEVRPKDHWTDRPKDCCQICKPQSKRAQEVYSAL